MRIARVLGACERSLGTQPLSRKSAKYKRDPRQADRDGGDVCGDDASPQVIVLPAD